MTDIASLDVLIVDDHEAMRVLLRKVLERAGVGHVRDTASAAGALTLLGEKQTDLILVDQMMPGMDGTALVQRLRSDGSTARIIMITGRSDARHMDAAKAAGVDAVLVKPVAPSQLLAAIERVLD